MYIIKIKGKVKIPDYIQLRDDQFTLLAYFRADRPQETLKKLGLSDKEEHIKKLISEIPYGKIKKVTI
ncbi:MAG: fructose-6-phosphate aldolase [Chitinophagales bacterium]|nr:fructose-6-phosphate aldolase [Chitinophagales bacterium]